MLLYYFHHSGCLYHGIRVALSLCVLHPKFVGEAPDLLGATPGQVQERDLALGSRLRWRLLPVFDPKVNKRTKHEPSLHANNQSKPRPTTLRHRRQHLSHDKFQMRPQQSAPNQAVLNFRLLCADQAQNEAGGYAPAICRYSHGCQQNSFKRSPFSVLGQAPTHRLDH